MPYIATSDLGYRRQTGGQKTQPTRAALARWSRPASVVRCGQYMRWGQAEPESMLEHQVEGVAAW